MNKDVLQILKKEIVYLIIILILAVVFAKIIFYKESIMILIRTIFSLFYLFLLSGYCLMLYWNKELPFLERVVIGIAASAALNGILGYYIGLIGINLKYHIFFIPVIMIILGIVFALHRKSE